MFPAIPVYEYDTQPAEFAALYDLLRNESDFPILGTPQDFVYPKKMFYDTVYHLNREGRSERTRRIIDFLDQALQKNGR